MRPSKGVAMWLSKAAAGEVDGVAPNDLIAERTHLPHRMQYWWCAHEEGVVVLVERAAHFEVVARLGDTELVGVFLEIAGAVLVAGDAGERVLGHERGR